MESGRIEPLRALPPATPVGQIYTMYIDFPLEVKDKSPRKTVPHIFSLLARGLRGEVLAPLGTHGGLEPAALMTGNQRQEDDLI